MPSEPPPDYVAFVDRRLLELRAWVSREVGGVRQAEEELLSDVLVDLAGHWTLLSWVIHRLRRPEVFDRYLGRSVRNRAERWRKEQIYPVEVTVWDPEATAGSVLPAAMSVRPSRPRPTLVPTPAAAPMSVSVAVRRAPFLDSTVREGFTALAEASIAWCHAYRANQRRYWVARLVLIGLFFLMLLALRP